jgi:dihydrofolate reductase
VSLTQYYTATSLDGFIAAPGHSLEWLLRRATDPEAPMAYGSFIREVGAMAMGANTYEWLVRHEFGDADPSSWTWPYEMPCWVFAHRDLPVSPGSGVTLTRDDPADVHAAMAAAAGGRNLWLVGGGELVGLFADRGLLDEIIVSIAPVTLGAGAPLLPRHLELRREELAINGEFVCARLTVVR